MHPPHLEFQLILVLLSYILAHRSNPVHLVHQRLPVLLLLLVLLELLSCFLVLPVHLDILGHPVYPHVRLTLLIPELLLHPVLLRVPDILEHLPRRDILEHHLHLHGPVLLPNLATLVRPGCLAHPVHPVGRMVLVGRMDLVGLVGPIVDTVVGDMEVDNNHNRHSWDRTFSTR